MKLNFLLLALVAAFGLSLACPAHAATTNAAPVMTAPAVKKTPYKGTLTAVDTATSTITVKGAKDTLMMTVTPTTKFKGGASLADFKVGDNVTGSYVKDETGKMTASSLHKKVAKP